MLVPPAIAAVSAVDVPTLAPHREGGPTHAHAPPSAIAARAVHAVKDGPSDATFSAPWRAMIRSASEANAQALALGLPVHASEIVVPGDLVFPTDLDIILVNVTVLGDLVVQSGAHVRLYGAAFRVQETFVPFVESTDSPLSDPEDHGLAVAEIDTNASLELHALHAWRAPGDLALLSALDDAPSLLDSAATSALGPVNDAVTTSTLATVSADFEIHAAPDSSLVIHNSTLRHVSLGVLSGTLDVADSLVEDSAQPFTATEPTGAQSIVRTTLARVDDGYLGTTVASLVYSGNTQHGGDAGVDARDSPGAVVTDNVATDLEYFAYIRNSPGAQVSGNDLTNTGPWPYANIRVEDSPDATVRDNTVAVGWAGIEASSDDRILIANNEVSDLNYGIGLVNSAAAQLLDNHASAEYTAITIWGGDTLVRGNHAQDAITCFDVASSTLDFNQNVASACRAGISIRDSPGSIVDNLAFDNTGAGLSVVNDVWADPIPQEISRNVARDNGWGAPDSGALKRGGIELSLVRGATAFDDNVMTNNALGLSLPYDSRDTLRVAHGTLVNGVNVDGTNVPAERLYWLGGFDGACDGGLSFTGLTDDITNGGTFVGAWNAQGVVTAYDCGPVEIHASHLTDNTHGVFVWNSPSLVVEGSLFDGNDVRYERWLNDPADDNVRSGGVFAAQVASLDVHDNVVHGAEVGLLDRGSEGIVHANTVESSETGIWSAGSSTRIEDNVVRDGQTGIFVRDGGNSVSRNTLERNLHTGISLLASSPLVADDVITGMGKGAGIYGDWNTGLRMETASPLVLRLNVTGVDRGIAGYGTGATLSGPTISNATMGISLDWGSAPTINNGTSIAADVGITSWSSGLTLTNARIVADVGIRVDYGSFSVTNTLITPTSPGANTTGFAAYSTSGTMSNSRIQGFLTGIDSTQSSVTCAHCSLLSNQLAARGASDGSLSFDHSRVQSNQAGILMQDGTIVDVQQSNLVSNKDYAVSNEDAFHAMTARNNWWGVATGAPVTGQNKAIGNVAKTPFLTSSVSGAGATV